MRENHIVAFDRFGIVEILDSTLTDIVAAGASSAPSSGSNPNANCVNEGCGSDINTNCYGSNTTCILDVNALCGANAVCSHP